MESACNLHRLKMLNEWLTKLLPLLMPWVLVPLGFSVFAAFLHGCANNSLQEVLVYVVVPMAIWMGFHNYCGASTYKPTFSPSSVAALITFMVGTYVSTLSTATHALFDGAFGVTSLLLVFTFWRMIRSDPGRLVPASAVMSIPGQLEQVNIKQIHADVPRAVEYADSIRLIGDFSTFMEINLHKESQHRNECSSCDRNQSFRTKHCKYCNVCIERYDHHCPAIYNCVGRKNHLLFLLMLVNFLIVEALFIISVDAYLVANHPARKLTTSVDEGRYLNYGNWTWQDISEAKRAYMSPEVGCHLKVVEHVDVLKKLGFLLITAIMMSESFCEGIHWSSLRLSSWESKVFGRPHFLFFTSTALAMTLLLMRCSTGKTTKDCM